MHGGNGFIEENPMARLYREAPLNSDLGGHGQHDVHGRAARHAADARCREAFFDELRASRGLNRIYDSCTEDLADRLRAQYPDDGHARALVTRMAHALQAAGMLQHGDADAADLFVKSRLGGDGMHVFGALSVIGTPWRDRGARRRHSPLERAAVAAKPHASNRSSLRQRHPGRCGGRGVGEPGSISQRATAWWRSTE